MLNDTTEMQSANPEDRSPYKTDTSFLNKEAEDGKGESPQVLSMPTPCSEKEGDGGKICRFQETSETFISAIYRPRLDLDSKNHKYSFTIM